MKTDIELELQVQEALHYDPSVEHSHIGVTVKEGVVTLRGTVPSVGEQWEAGRIAERVEGVKAVINHLEVAPANVAVPAQAREW
jgi:osmotically-inducible protein OsmY